MRIPEGSQEKDFNGRKLAAGRIGQHNGRPVWYEVYVSWVWQGRRYLCVVGVVYQSALKRWRHWFRRTSWNTRY